MNKLFDCHSLYISFKKILYIFLFCTFVLTHSISKAQNKIQFPLSNKATKCLVDSLASQINKFYIEKEAAKKISAYLKQRLKDGVYYQINDANLLAGLLTSDVLSVHKDEHFHVDFNPEMADEVSGNIEDVPKMVAQKLQKDKQKNFGFKSVEILNGNIGYLEISGFSRLNKYSKATANAAFALLSNAHALIIDLRYGVGGSPEMVTHILSHFFKEKTHVNDIYIRSENVTLPYFTTPDSNYQALYNVPIYILTSYKTFSAAEGLAYALQSLKRATIVGEKTRGGAHTVSYRPLGSGFIADIPFGKATDPVTKKTWEGIGVVPDIITEAELALEVAEKAIYEKALRAAQDSTDLHTLKWQHELFTSKNKPTYIDTNNIKNYAGVYGIYSVSYQNATLYYQKIGMAKFPLVQMNSNKFRPMSNDSFMVEFVRDASSNELSLVTYYDDGRITKSKLSK